MKLILPAFSTRPLSTNLRLLALIILSFGNIKGFAQIYKFTNDSTGMYNSKNPNVTATALGLGSGVKHDNYPPCGPTDGLGTDGWPTTNTFNVNTFNTNGDYVTFTITPNMGYGLKITGFSARSRRENLAGTADDGPIAIRYGYSLDGGVNWTTVNPGNPLSSNLCSSGGVLRVWPSWLTLNISGPVIFRIYGLSSGTSFKGDLFLRDVTVDGELCTNAPNIVLGTSPEKCFSPIATTTSLPYTSSTGAEYRIDYDMAAQGVGFTSTPPATFIVLPASPLPISIPAAAPPGIYNGTVTVRNGCGFVDPSPEPFTVTVNALPVPAISVSESSGIAPDDAIICNGASATLTASGGNAYLWSTSGTAASILVSPSVSTTYTVTVTSEAGCNATASQTITVNPVTATANAGPDQVLTCDYGSIFLNGMIGGTASSSTWSSSIMGGSFSSGANSLTGYYTPPSGNSDPFTMTLTTNGACPASDVMMVTYGDAPPLVLEVTGPDNATCGEEIVFNIVAVSGFVDLTSLQYKVEWDETKLAYVSSTGVTIGGVAPGIGEFSTASGELVYAWFTATGEDLPGNSTLLTITLKVISNTGSSGVNINGDMIVPIEAVNFQLCQVGVNTSGMSVTLSPINVNCPTNQLVCVSASTYPLAGGSPAGGTYSGTGVSGNMFNPSVAGVGMHTITYTYTDGNDCTNSCTFSITVNALPNASASNKSICSGAQTNLNVTNPNAVGGSFNWVATYNGATGGMGSSSGVAYGVNAINEALTNPTNAIINVMYRITPIGPAPTFCQGSFFDVFVAVNPSPVFGFSASTTSNPAESADNDPVTLSPNSISVDFCSGNLLTLSGYSDNGNVGYAVVYTTSGNVTYDGGALPLMSGPSNVAPASAAGFFGTTYGGTLGYGLSSGTYGVIDQSFVPYMDLDGSGTLTPGDCEGAPVQLIYKIYAPIVVNVTRNANNLCSGGLADYTISTTSTQNVLFDLNLSENTDGANPADLDDDNTFPIVLTGLSINDLSSYHFTQVVNNALGTYDRGQVLLTVSNVRYADNNLSCGVTINNTQANTQVYPKPRLNDPADKFICTGNSTDIDIDLLGLSSLNSGTAGYPVRIEWTVSSLNVLGASNGFVDIYDASGLEVAVNDIAQVLSLSNPLLNGTATYTITPRAAGPTIGFNGDDCFGDPITVTITVVAPSIPSVEGPICVHELGQIQLTGIPNINPPASYVSESWSSTPNASVDGAGLVTGLNVGPATITYTVTDDAGCTSSATYQITVLEDLLIEHIYTGDPVSCGEEFEVLVDVENFCDINTLDYPFTWDPNAFQLVTFNTPFQPANGTFLAFSNGPGELYLSFFDDGNAPFGNDLPDNTVVLSYTLRAVGSFGTYNIPDVPPATEAFNSSFLLQPVNTYGISVPIEAIGLDLLGNPEVCPNEDFAYLEFTNVQGNPDYYVIDFGPSAEAAGFPDIQQGTLVVMDGEIIIPLPNGLLSGSYPAVLVVSSTVYGCESAEYPFSIIVDQTLPTASLLHPTISQACLPAPAPNAALEVINAMDNCPGPLMKMWVGDVDNGGSGCGFSPKIITRTYKVVDQAGNTSTISLVQTITILDNVSPTVSTTGLAAWYPSVAAAEAAALARANATKMDNCTPPVGINVSLASASSPNGGCGWTVHVAVSDACGNLIIANYNVIVDVDPPTVTAGIIDDCYDEDETPTAPYFENDYAVQAAILATTATDDCDESLTITVSVSGTDCARVITVTATDDCGKSNSVSYTTRVENDAPIIFPYNTLALDGDCFTSEQDALDAAIAATLAGDDCTPPNDLQYDAFANGGCPAEIMVVVTDFCGNPSTITYTGVYIDTEDPEVALDEPYPTCFETEAQAFAALAAAANPTDNCSTEAELLAIAVFAPYTGDPCNLTLVVTFTDHCGRTVSATFYGITIDNEDPTGFATGVAEYECIDDVDVPEVTESYLSVSDNCSEEPLIEFYSDYLPAHCGTGYRTYTVTDCAGNSTFVTLTIIVNDELAPEWTTTPSNELDRTFLCGEDISGAIIDVEPEAWDPNCGDVDVVLISDVTGGGCTNQNRTRVWTAFDACGNEVAAPFTQVITIVDNLPPTWTTLPAALNTSVECSDPAGLAVAQTWAPVASNACTGFTIIKTSGIFVAGGSCPQEGTYTNTWKATDACGNTSTVYTQVITITDNTAPTWITPQGQPYPIGLNFGIACDDELAYDFANSFVPVATDNCDMEFGLTKTTGMFVPGVCLGSGSFTNTWVATDECGNTSTVFSQTITVVDNTPPTFLPGCQFMPLNLYTSNGYACPASATLTGLVVNQEINEGTTWNVAGFTVPPLAGCISDNCVPSSSIIIKVISIVNQYNALNCSRTITVSFELRDPCGNVQPTLFVCIYNVIDDTKPIATAGTIGTCFATEAAALAAAIAATTVSDNCTATPDLVKTAVRTGTLCAATITVTVTDCAGNVSLPVTYNTRIDNSAPTMVLSSIPTCYLTVAAAQAAAIAGTTIMDDCNTYGQLTITATTVGTCPATITVSATDQCGNSRSVVYSGICIGAAGEVVIAPEASNLNVDCNGWQSDLAAWLANHGGASAAGSGIVWSYLPLDPATVLQMSMPNCTTHTKSVVVTFRATNGCNNYDETTATFSVTDNTPPTANPIANTNLTCNTGIPAPDVNLVTGEADNCGGTPTVALFATSDNMAPGCPGNPRIIVHQYVVTDAYCNTTLVNHLITIVDNIAPTFTGPANITINVDGSCNYNASPAVTGDVTNESDNCTPSGPGLQATYTDVVAAGPTGQNPKYIITRTWRLTDACGNTAIPRVQTITVQDLINPTIVGCPANSTQTGGLVVVESNNYPCGWTFTGMTSPAFNDNCPNPVLSYHLVGFFVGAADGTGSIDGRIFLEGTTTVTYTVTDCVGNTATCSFTVTVNCLTISGRIIWEHDAVSGVKNATVNAANVLPTPAFMGSDLSDTNGDYDITVPGAGTYKLTPVKNTGGNAGRMNGVDAADATRVTNHVNFSNPITNPYKKVCADVNRSGIINTQDATLITQCIAGNPTAQAVFNVFWRFVPTTYPMPATAHQNVPVFPAFKDVTVAAMDVLGVNFFGMKIGDVDAAWANPQNAPNLAPLVWMLKDQTLVAGTEVDLSFAASNFNDLAAYQMALDFDPNQLQFVGFQPLSAIPMNLLDNFGAYNADLGELRNVWSVGTGTTLSEGTLVFKAKFKVLKSGQKLSDVLKLDDSEIPCKAYTAALVPTDMKLVFTESVGTETAHDLGNLQLQLLQNRPNPFSDATTIGFILPEACEAHIRILDISGRELASYGRSYTAGYHELDFRMENAWSYGMLFCELVTPQGKRTIKMITAK